jgi:cytochrome P450
MPINYNPLAPAVQDDPYPYYAELRRNTPVAWVEPLQCWAVSRYQDVDYAIKHPQLFSSAKWLGQSLGDLNPMPEIPWMLETDPPDHTRLRKLVNKAFTPRMVSLLEPRIRGIARQLLAPLQQKKDFDFVRELSGPLPVIVIAEMLGIEPEHRVDFKRWSDNVVRASNRPTAEAERAEIQQSNSEMRAYLTDAIERRRREPREDLLTALVRAEEERQMLTADEVLAMTLLILLAGNETTTNLLGNTVLTLLAHPADLAAVRADRALVPALIEEVLRYDSPIQVVFRRMTQDVQLSGTTLAEGSAVFLLLGSANRDDRKFPDPDHFDLRRNRRDHVAFGYGIHYCLGAELARLEAKMTLETLLFECPAFVPATERPQRVSSVLIRGPQTLPLRFETTRPAMA